MRAGVRRAVKPSKVKRLPAPAYQAAYRTTAQHRMGLSPSEIAEQSDLELTFSHEGIVEAMSPGTMQEWAMSERGVKRPQEQSMQQPMFTPAAAHAEPTSPSKLQKCSPSEDKPMDQSDLDITFTAMTEGLDEAMMENQNAARQPIC